MADYKKKKRQVVGSVCKSKDPAQVDYIKMRDSGKIYRLESQAYQLKSLEAAVAAGKLTEDVAEKVRERINKIPTWIRFELVELVDAE